MITNRIKVTRELEFKQKLNIQEEYYNQLQRRLSCIRKGSSIAYIADVVLELMELVLFTHFVHTGSVRTKCEIKEELTRNANSERHRKASILLENMYRVRNSKAHMNTDLDLRVRSFLNVLQRHRSKQELKEVMSLLYPDDNVPNCIYDIFNFIVDEDTDIRCSCIDMVHNLLRDISSSDRTVGKVRSCLLAQFDQNLIDDCILQDIKDYSIVVK